MKLFFKKQTCLIFSFIALFVVPFNLLHSYNDTDTHPDLTVEIVKLYNLQNQENKLTNEEMELVRLGSIMEDTPPRWINHFYNPETGEGWTAKNLKGVSQENLQTVSNWFFSFEPPVSSLNWAYNQELQNKYSFYQGNHTFQKAVYDYAKGEKVEGLKSLGFLLHLIEDASVPDHTRDDTHADISNVKNNADEGSPYEDWAENYTKNNTLNIAETLNSQNRKYYNCGSFNECLINLAKYSHYNFFSEDTIGEYEMPKIFGEVLKASSSEQIIKHYFNSGGNILVKSINKLNNNKLESSIFTVNDPQIMHSYWSLLSAEVTLTGAGVIEIFFKEVEKAKNDPERLASLKHKGKQTTLAQDAFMPAFFLFADKVISPFGEYARWSGFINEVKESAKSATSKLKSIFAETTNNQQIGILMSQIPPVTHGIAGMQNNQTAAEDPLEHIPQNQINVQIREQEDTFLKAKSESESKPQPKVLGETASRSQTSGNFQPAIILMGYTPGFGGGGSASDRAGNGNDPSLAQVTEGDQNNGSTTENGSNSQNQNNSGSQNQNNTTSTENGSGGNNSGNQNQNGNENSAASTSSTSQEQATSTNATSSEQTTDTTPPQITLFKILECDNSIATDGCLVATTTINLIWLSESEDLDYYELVWNSETEGQPSTLVLRSFSEVGTSTALTLNEGEHTLSLRAKDKSGNYSEPQTINLEINLKPIVINEVAWAGTGRQTSNDEWLELYNRTGHIINLSNFALYAKDLAPYINFKKRNSPQNTLAPKSYYLLERTDDDTVEDIEADQFFTGALDNQREELFLVYVSGSATTTIDKTKTCNVHGSWCGGSNDSYETMERHSPNGSYWGSNLQVIRNGENSQGNKINGTPKARNSLNYLIIPPNESAISENLTLTKDESPYYIHTSITVPRGKMLTIEPGTIIKTRSGGEYYLNVEGELNAEGTENEEIVFTSFYDDEYGGDLDGYGSATPSRLGDWTKVLFSQTSSSTINYARFRYGGRHYGIFCCQGMVKIDRATSTITNSTFENSYSYGLELISSNSRVENNTFQNNNNYPQFANSAGLSIGGAGSLQILNNTFQGNFYGLHISGGSEANIENNTFNNNAGKAIFVSGTDGIGTFKNNSGILAGGQSDGVYITNLRLKPSATTTLYSNSLPYIFHNNPTVPAGATLAIESNVLIKNTSDNRIEVYGTLETKGQNKDDVVFTSLTDNGNDYWFGISANSNSKISLSGTTVKYGGRIMSRGSKEKEAALYADRSDIAITNSLFYGNYKNGVILVNSTSGITNSEFENHALPQLDSRGLAYYNSAINLNNVSFKNNYFGLYADAGSLVGTIIAPIIFEGNASSSNIRLP